jgi:teichuronic acid biosynthesis glycosyltransferase TuaG
MPAYNSAKWISDSIQSVLNQTYHSWELIVINDNSTDNTKDIVSSFINKDSRIKLLNLEVNRGVSYARNFGVSHSQGEFIAFLDSDDLWMPKKLEKQVCIHEKNPAIKISHTDYNIFNENGLISTPFKFIFSKFSQRNGDLLNQLLFLNTIGILTLMVERKVFTEHNGFDVNQWGMEDHDLWLRISRSGLHFTFIPDILASYRINQNGMMYSLGKYKRTYKKFLSKNEGLLLRHKMHAISKSYYYRYFGITNFKMHEYKVAKLYLAKSLHLYYGFYFQLITLPYFIISFVRSFLIKAKKPNINIF